MTFEFPIWLLLFAAIPFLWRRAKLYLALRLIAFSCLVLSVAGLSIVLRRGGIHLWVLADNSDSIVPSLADRQRELIQLLEKTRPDDGVLHIVDFATGAVERGPGQAPFEDRKDASRLGHALQFAIGRMASSSANRVLVLSDGYPTDGVAAAKSSLIERRLPVDLRILELDRSRDTAVTSLRVANRAPVGSSTIIEVAASGPDGSVPLTLLKNGRPIGKDTIRVQNNRGFIRLLDTNDVEGAYKYEVRIEGRDDPIGGNNSRSAWHEAVGPGHVLVLSSFERDPV